MMPVSEYSKDTDRTTDVQTQDQNPFLTIIKGHPVILKGLTDCGYINASPIQVAALPAIIAGNDTIVEAKNGTGKTLTFVIPTLMRLKVEQSHLQSIILAPTREIAVQIQQCFKKVGQFLPEMKCEYFIGGTPVQVDKEKANGCQIAVGSPGRIKHLLNEHVLKGSEVKSFILDEVDRLFTDKNFTKDVRLIDAKLPKLKQMIFVSASIDKNNMSLFDEFMKEYVIVKGAEEDMNASQDPSKFLLGIKQYVACVKAVSTNIILLPAKNVRLLNILQNLPYTQCIIFTNYMTRVEAVCNMLRDHNYKADYIRGDQDQNIRLKLVDRLTSFKSKILVATDLIARGIDSSNVDLVINMDCPNDWATYLHRIGRAGRFGNKGNAFTILDDDKELKSFKRIINSIENVQIKILPIAIKKPILEYEDTELEDLNLTIESDVLTKPQSENNVIEENQKENEAPNSTDLKSSDLELNISSSTVKSKRSNETKSVYDHTELEGITLINKPDVLIKPQNENSVIEENSKENEAPNETHLKFSDSELNISSSTVISEQKETKSVDGHTELESINLIIEPDILAKPLNENNVIAENNKENEAQNGTNLKFSDFELNISSSTVKSEQNETKSVYGHTELEGINLTIEPDVLTKFQNKKDVTEENKKENKAPNGAELKFSDPEPNISSSPVQSEQLIETVNVNGLGLSEDCSLKKLSQAVKETEKKLIDNNLIDQKHLTADRSFVLFDPEPLLNDTDQYMKYSPQELIDIITNYDSDFEKYEATKKSTSQKCLVSNDMNKENFNIDQINLENSSSGQLNSTNEEVKDNHTNQQPQCLYLSQNDCEEKSNTIEIDPKKSIFSNETNSAVDNKIDTNTTQRPRFTNIYDLFQIPDFSLLKAVQSDNIQSSNKKTTVKENSNMSTHKKDSIQEECKDEELFSNDSEDFNVEEESSNFEEEEEEETSNVEEEEELSNVEEEDEEFSNVEEDSSYVEEEEENKSFDDDIESKSSNYSDDNHERFSIKSNDKSIQKSIHNNIQENYATPRKVTYAIEDNDEHLVDYDILNDWYRKWKQQMNFIQTCVRMSK